jgi:hypothetical protein
MFGWSRKWALGEGCNLRAAWTSNFGKRFSGFYMTDFSRIGY